MVVQADDFAAACAVAGGVYHVRGYSNGESDWSQLQGRKVIIWPLQEPQAAKLAAVGAALRYLPPDRRPDEFSTYDELLAWARDNVQPYESASEGARTSGEADQPRETPSDAPTGDADTPPLSAYHQDAETRPSVDSRLPDWSWKADAKPVDGFATVPAHFWGGVNLPQIPESAVPPAFIPWAQDQAARTGCDPCQFYLNALGIAAAAITEHIGLLVKPQEKWIERARLWCAVVGPPSVGKGPALDAAFGPLKEIDDDHRAANTAATEAHEMEERIYQGKVTDYVADKRKGRQVMEPIKPERPRLTRLYTQNFTKEAVAPMLANHPRGKIAAIVPELAAVLGSMSAYSTQKGNEKDRAEFLDFYDGPQKYWDRAADGKSLFVQHWSMPIIGGIQPSILDRYARGMNGNVGMAEDGMLARMMMVIAQPQQLTSNETRPDVGAEALYAAIIRNLVAMHSDHFLRLSGDAQEYRYDKEIWIRRMMNSGLPESLEFAIGKWTGLHMRLSLIYHCIENAARGLTVPDSVITLDSVARAWSWLEDVQYPHLAHFYNVTLGATDERKEYKQCADLILAEGIGILTTTRLAPISWFRKYKAGSRQQKEWFMGFCETGWIRPHPDYPTRYIVNPSVFDIFSWRIPEAVRQREVQAGNMHENWKAKTRMFTRTPGEEG